MATYEVALASHSIRKCVQYSFSPSSQTLCRLLLLAKLHFGKAQEEEKQTMFGFKLY